jgi:8-oxo-dGTP pyrophosphatase MutT (NUDIX family)
MIFSGLGLFGRLGRVLSPSSGGPGAVGRQFGAIPYRHVDGETVFLMITARRTGKWIFPKGDPVEGLTPAESAAEEAYEEAGVRGRIGAAPAGHYRAFRARAGKARAGKVRPAVKTPVLVEMYPLEVAEQFDDWPEKGERRRHWATLAEARRLLSEPGLVALAEKIAQSAPGQSVLR